MATRKISEDQPKPDQVGADVALPAPVAISEANGHAELIPPANPTVSVTEGGESRKVGGVLARLTDAVDRDTNPERPDETVDRDASLLKLSTTAMPQPGPAVNPPTDGPKRREITVEVEVVYGNLFDVASPAAVVGQYLGLPLKGTTAEVDKRLHSWLKRSFESGIASARLGELNFFPLEHWKPRPITPNNVLVAGLGDPSHFTRSDLQFLYMNIVLALKSGGFDGFSVTIVNASRFGLTLDRVVLTILDGARDAFERLVFAAPLDDVLNKSLDRPFRITFVDSVADNYRLIEKTLCAGMLQSQKEGEDPHFPPQSVWLNLKVIKRRPPPKRLLAVAPRSEDDHDSASDTRPSQKVVRLTVSSLNGENPLEMARAPRRAKAHSPNGRHGRQVFQCSAVTESSIMPVREVEVEPYFVERIPEKLRHAPSFAEQEKFGLMLPSYFLPEEFLKLLEREDGEEKPPSLTLVVDQTTAMFPWEMAAIRTGNEVSFFGPGFQLTRQFRTLLADCQGVPPPLNDRLEVLVIADPGDGQLHLPGAFEEGLAVARALVLAEKAWGNQLGLKLTLRLGNPDRLNKQDLEAQIRKNVPGIPDEFVNEADTCDPVEILALLMGNRYDVVHYAGHGIFDPLTDREGWVFNLKCTLSARAIFKIRQVPRLVFANACHSSAVETTSDPLPHLAIDQVSLAEAFLARGIENYIGAGWQVNDGLAADFASQFYLQALGVTVLGPDQIEVKDVAPPATLGGAVASARVLVMDKIRARGLRGEQTTIWGAYQHYGEVNSKLLPFTNDDADHANDARKKPK